jgi:hypothetical protein
MIQRKVQDSENLTWSCVQALSGLSGEAAEEATERVESGKGTVPVVCTPSGGEQSVRIELPTGWDEQMSDEDLCAAIAEVRE